MMFLLLGPFCVGRMNLQLLFDGGGCFSVCLRVWSLVVVGLLSFFDSLLLLWLLRLVCVRSSLATGPTLDEQDPSDIFHLLLLNLSFNSSLITQPTSNNANSATVSPTNQSRRFGLKVSTLTNQTNQFDLKSGSVLPTSSLAESISDTSSPLLPSLTTTTAIFIHQYLYPFAQRWKELLGLSRALSHGWW